MSVRCFSQAGIAVARWNPSFSDQRWARQCGAGSTSFAELLKRVENVQESLDEREVAQHVVQSNDLTRNKLCYSQSNDIGNGTHVCNESSYSLLVRPLGSEPRPKTISLLSTTSTSKWIAIREHPNALSQSRSGSLER